MGSIQRKLVSIRSRLLFLVLFALFGMFVAGGMGWICVLSVSSALTETSEVHLPAIREVESMRGALSQLRLLNIESLSWGQEYDIDERLERMLKKKSKISDDLQRSLEIYSKVKKTRKVEETWNNFQPQISDWIALDKKVNASLDTASKMEPGSSEQAAALASLKGILTKDQLKKHTTVENALDNLIEESSKSSSEAQKSAKTKSAVALSTMALAILVVGGLLLVFSWIIVRSIVTPVEAMRKNIVTIAQTKDFTLRLQSKSQDEIGQTIRAFDDLITEIQASIRRVLENAEKIGLAAQDASKASGKVADSSHAQSEAAASMASAVEEMTVSIDHVTNSSQEALAKARSAGDAAVVSARSIERGAEGMGTIAQTVREAGDTIDALGQQSNQINGIMSVIKEVAEQTNLLALNAAIEAARAGESGRGFAVVADEVRKLAERTAKSTQEISQTVNSMQASTRKAVEHMKTVIIQVDEGKGISSQASNDMLGIRDSAQGVAGAVQIITESLSEQNVAAHEIARQIEQVAQMTDENAAVATETADIAHSLEQLSNDLRLAMDQFKV